MLGAIMIDINYRSNYQYVTNQTINSGIDLINTTIINLIDSRMNSTLSNKIICLDAEYFDCMTNLTEYLTNNDFDLVLEITMFNQSNSLYNFKIKLLTIENLVVAGIANAVGMVFVTMVCQVAMYCGRQADRRDKIILHKIFDALNFIFGVIFIVILVIIYAVEIVLLDSVWSSTSHGLQNGARLYGTNSIGKRITNYVICKNNFDCLNNLVELWNVNQVNFVTIDNIGRYHKNTDYLSIVMTIVVLLGILGFTINSSINLYRYRNQDHYQSI